jgi:predicted transposase YdaD
VIDADIATISGAADKVLRVATDPAYLLHLEFVAGHDAAALPRKLHVRNGLLDDRRDLGVRTAVVLLHPGADSPQLTGVYQHGFPGEDAYLTFHYQVVRVWRLSPESLLTGGIPLLSLAPISDVTEAELPGIIQRMDRRLQSPDAREQAPVVWGAAYILLGLRYSPALAEQLFRGVMTMRESSTYMAILEEGLKKGREEGAVSEVRKLLRKFGERNLGPPDTPTATALDRIDDLARLEQLLEQLPNAETWNELLGPSGPPDSGNHQQASP